MSMVSFTFLPVLAAGTASVQASNTVSGTVFTDSSLDEAIWGAFSEGVLALLVFGAASAMMTAYRRHTSKGLRPKKAKAMHHDLPKVDRARTSPAAAGHAEVAATTRKPPALYKAGAGLPNRSPPGLPTPGPAARGSGKLSEADTIAAAVRAGKASELPRLLDAAMARSLAANRLQGCPLSEEQVATSLLHSSLKACAAARCFHEAIAAYDHLKGRIGEGSLGLWSVLLYSVVEAEAFCRCKDVFENLCRQGNPSGHDFVNMVRCFARQQDAAGLRDMLATMRSSAQSVDTYTWNRALAACGNMENSLDLAEELANAGICAEGLDAVGYNTLMKYNARAGRLSRCFELHTEMLAKGLQASEVTFGILLDVCVGAQELDHARKVFDDLCKSGLRLNVVHCTTFIKGLAGAGKLDEAAGVLQEMTSSSGVKPDLITYSTIVRAYAESGNVAAAMKIVEQMLEEGVKPDEIIYNSVLTACSVFPLKSAHVLRTFEKLISIGMRPTTTTLSILLKGLAHTEAWAQSLQVLKDSPTKLRLQPEMRLYSQLGQSCAKARSFPVVLEIFNAMLDAARLRGEAVDPVSVSRFLRSCLSGGSPEMAQELGEVAQKAGVVVETSVVKMVKSALSRRGRVDNLR